MTTTNWTVDNIPSQKEKNYFITGASSGLGLDATWHTSNEKGIFFIV